MNELQAFITEARKCLTPETRAKLRRLLNFRAVKSGKYNYPAAQLKLLEQQVRKRAGEILEE